MDPPDGPAPADPLIATAENVIVRNITFEDAYDFFPAWTPDDSYSDPPEVADPASLYPLCQATLSADETAGPHQCPGGRWNASYDNITVQNARHVWIDANTFNDGDRDKQESVWAAPYDQHAIRFQPHDGALDINGTSDFVTVSRNVFRNHDKVMLIGGSDTVRETNGWGYLSVTVHHNQFINCGQRMPRVRFGKVHTYSNLIRGTRPPVIATEADRAKEWPDYPYGSGLAVGHLAKVYSENNVYNISVFEGDPPATAANVVSTAHRETPATGDTLDVGQSTYFFDAGSTLQAAPAAAAPVDLNAYIAMKVMEDEDPPILSTEDVWKPADSYSYRATAAGGVNAELGRLSGAGKIAIGSPPAP
jgi:pectate lyase